MASVTRKELMALQVATVAMAAAREEARRICREDELAAHVELKVLDEAFRILHFIKED